MCCNQSAHEARCGADDRDTGPIPPQFVPNDVTKCLQDRQAEQHEALLLLWTERTGMGNTLIPQSCQTVVQNPESFASCGSCDLPVWSLQCCHGSSGKTSLTESITGATCDRPIQTRSISFVHPPAPGEQQAGLYAFYRDRNLPSGRFGMRRLANSHPAQTISRLPSGPLPHLHGSVTGRNWT